MAKRGPKPKSESMRWMRIVVDNMRDKHTYTRVFDPKWQKDGLSIYPGDMDDPTIGHRQDLCDQMADLLAETDDGILKAKQLYIWSPALQMHLDLFTLHCYEDLGEEVFQNLYVFFMRVDIDQTMPSAVHFPEEFPISEATRLAFIAPAFSKLFIDIGYTLK